MTKIWIVTNNYPTEKQPYLQPFIRDQVKVISEMDDYEVRVLVASPFLIPFSDRWNSSRCRLLDPEIAKRFSYLSIPRRYFPGFTGSNLTRNLLKELPYDDAIVHIHWLYPNALSVPKLKQAGYRTILNIHGTDWHSTKNDPRFSSLIRKVLMNSDVVVVSGEEIKQEIQERFPLLNIRVSYNYIDTNLFQIPSENLIREAQKKLGFDPDKLNILTIANIRPEKGIDLYIDAIAALNRSDICFHIVGQPATGAFANLIANKLNALTSEIIKFHSPVPRHQIPFYYYAADAYLLPSRSEGFNVSLLEALATGLPVVATDTGGASDVLGDDRGCLIKAGSTDAIISAIEDLADDSKSGRSKNSREFIMSRFSLKHYSRFLRNLYSGIIGENSADNPILK